MKLNEEKINKELIKERECVIDACLVRIMKGKKQLLFNELIPDSISMIKTFKADI